MARIPAFVLVALIAFTTGRLTWEDRCGIRRRQEVITRLKIITPNLIIMATVAFLGICKAATPGLADVFAFFPPLRVLNVMWRALLIDQIHR